MNMNKGCKLLSWLNECVCLCVCMCVHSRLMNEQMEQNVTNLLAIGKSG